LAVKQAIVRHDDELRVLVMKHEEEVAASMNKREEEIMEAVQRRDAEICVAWVKREGEIRKEVKGTISHCRNGWTGSRRKKGNSRMKSFGWRT